MTRIFTALAAILVAACGQASTTSAPTTPARDGGCVGGGPPTDDTAQHDVRFELTNTSSTTWYVGEFGLSCRSWTLATMGGALVKFGADQHVWCEGFPQSPQIGAWTEVAPGQSTTVSWDGRHGSIYTRCLDCATRGVPGRIIQEPMTQRVVTPPDDYIASFAITRSIPAAPPLGSFPRNSLNDLCPDTQRVDITFTLPSSGTVAVPVAFP